jgi:DNA (cytosine-5)-methyltransferase 1
MNIVTGCSGIDAIAYAGLLLGMEISGQIEIDSFCNTILDLRYPGVMRCKDIFEVKGDEFGAVDIFAAGIPCQPFSHAGKREGTEDDRYLWPETIRIIRVMQSTWVIIENVDGIGSMEQSDSQTVMETETEICQDAEMVLETIRRDLEEAGYNSIVIILPACSVEAPHQRYRYFIVGNSESERSTGEHISIQSGESREANFDIDRSSEALGNTKCSGCDRESRGRSEQEPEDGYSRIETMADTKSEQSPMRFVGEYCKQEQSEFRGSSSKDAILAYPDSEHCQNCNITASRGKQGIVNGSIKERGEAGATQPGMGGNADGLSSGVHRPGGQEDSSGILGAFEDVFTTLLRQILWPAGYGAEQYEHEPPRVAAGVKNRTNRLKVLGNAIVWQQIFPILLAIKLIEEGGKSVEETL